MKRSIYKDQCQKVVNGKSNSKFAPAYVADRRPFMLKYFLRFFVAILLIAGISEIVLRKVYGFCNSPLYVNDPDFEYIYAPNQEVNRFGNLIRTNSLSMRSDELSASDTTVILLLGDSVINGGSLTDHDSIGSSMLEKRFTKAFGRKVRVLNISAGSWGPDNIAAYLTKYGLFGAKVICLVTSSHDAHDIMSHNSPVGIDPGMPDKQYDIALVEVWDRYRYWIWYNFLALLPSFDSNKNQSEETIAKKEEVKLTLPDSVQKDTIKKIELNDAGIRKPGIGFNPGYQQILDLAKTAGIPLFIYLHPETSEIELGHFNDQGDEIIRFAEANNIRLINEFDLGIKRDYYRKLDVVHYNNEGQVFLANNLYPIFLEYLKDEK
jgi:lysophospholipase L1-like esterase